MKVAVNLYFGGFMLPDKICEILKCDTFNAKRDDPKLIELIEKYGSDDISAIGIAEFPDTATDWMITEYDGVETCYYVLDGKIKTAKNYTVINGKYEEN